MSDDDTDDDVRALFHGLDDGPPLGIDVHQVMAGGRRTRTRRARLAVAGSTLAVAVIVATGLTLARDVQQPDNVRPATPQPPTSEVAPAVPRTDVPGPDDDMPRGGTSAPEVPNPAGPPGSADTPASDGAPTPGGGPTPGS
jgi:hypothetical protein